MVRLIADIRARVPGLAKRAETSPLCAIRLFCLECVGDSAKLVSECATTTCPLWRFRFAKGPRAAGLDNLDADDGGV